MAAYNSGIYPAQQVPQQQVISQQPGVPQQTMVASPQWYEMPPMEVDVSNCCLKFCACGWDKLKFEKEEVVRDMGIHCGWQTLAYRSPYGNTGAIFNGKQCCCCYGASFNLGPIVPGCGCSKDTVDEVTAELRRRYRGRGVTGQIRTIEEHITNMHEMDQSMDGLLSKHGVVAQLNPPKQTAHMQHGHHMNMAGFYTPQAAQYDLSGP